MKKTKQQSNSEGVAEALPAQPKNEQPEPMESWVAVQKARGPEYRTWDAMKQRCGNPKVQGYHNYGGRGITFCQRWNEFKFFFLDMGFKPTPQHSIERKNNALGYSKANCIWATPSQQGRNKRTNRILEHKGQSKTVAEWAEEIGIKQHVLQHRIGKLKWSVSRAVSTPLVPNAIALGHEAEADIIKSLQSRALSERQLASKYGVSRPVIRRIANRRTVYGIRNLEEFLQQYP